MLPRRTFLKKTLIGSGVAMLGHFPFTAFADRSADRRLVVLHTNDTHCHFDPFPNDGSIYSGLGGIARRAALIAKIRAAEPQVLLLDAGDIFQGTAYFNLYKGALAFRLMSRLKYDAATMGEHEFDLGLEGFKRQLPLADFPFLTANYDFDQTILKGATLPYQLFKKGAWRIGVFGLGIRLWGLAANASYGDTRYLDPIAIGRAISTKLKRHKKCDLVICLSHLGYDYKYKKVSDRLLAAETTDLDVIIGGHTHTFLAQPVLVKNKAGRPVIINQAGWAGINMGKLIFELDSKNNTKTAKAQTVIIGKETRA